MTSFAESNRRGAHGPNEPRRNGGLGTTPAPTALPTPPTQPRGLSAPQPSQAGSSAAQHAHARGAPGAVLRDSGPPPGVPAPFSSSSPPPFSAPTGSPLRPRDRSGVPAASGRLSRRRRPRARRAGPAAAAKRSPDSDPARGTQPATAKAREGAGSAALGGAAAAEARTWRFHRTYFLFWVRALWKNQDGGSKKYQDGGSSRGREWLQLGWASATSHRKRSREAAPRPRPPSTPPAARLSWGAGPRATPDVTSVCVGKLMGCCGIERHSQRAIGSDGRRRAVAGDRRKGGSFPWQASAPSVF
jgi:hypothetical protein